MVPKNVMERILTELEHTRFLVYFDLLGFSELVKGNYLKDVVESFLDVMTAQNEIIKDSRKVVIQGDILEPVQGYFWFSDTLILYSRDSSTKNLLNLIPTASYIIASLLNKGFPSRCIITSGQFYVGKHNSNQDIFLGKALINAYELEKNVNWCGGVIDSSIVECEEIKEMKRNNEIVSYNPPLKKSGIVEYKCLNWPKYYKANFHGTAQTIRDKMVEKIKTDIEPCVKEKIRNTEEFFTSIMK